MRPITIFLDLRCGPVSHSLLDFVYGTNCVFFFNDTNEKILGTFILRLLLTLCFQYKKYIYYHLSCLFKHPADIKN